MSIVAQKETKIVSFVSFKKERVFTDIAAFTRILLLILSINFTLKPHLKSSFVFNPSEL